jgi:hypothetical protein
VYRLGDVVAARLQAPVPAAQLPAPAAAEPDADTITVTAERMRRTVMTAAFPGRMALRPLQAVLTEAFGQTRSVGFLSELLTQAGQRAGRILQTIDHSPLGPVIVVRDETFFQDWPILLVLEPVSSTILLAHVSEDRTAETWGAALLVAQDQGATIAGLVEDMARSYPKSQKLAEIDVEVQKDTWHVTHQGAQVGQDLQRQALNAVRKVDALEDKLRKQWQDELFFEQYIPAVALEEQRVAQYHSYANLFGHLCDALELVDVRSGEIRDRQTNNWLLEETLIAMRQLGHTRVDKFVKTLCDHQSQLFTYLDWMAAALSDYRATLAQHIGDPTAQQQFVATVARCWRLRQARINGQGHRWQRAAAEAELDLWVLTDEQAHLTQLADQLLACLDAAGHTSSMIESINGLLKSFLKNRRAFRNADTAQAYLNLFVLWHNMRVYQRGKRAGASPFQLAGIDPRSNDWLDLLGFPASDN